MNSKLLKSEVFIEHHKDFSNAHDFWLIILYLGRKGINMIRKIEKVLDEQIRPALQSHGGDIEVVDFDNNKLFVKMSGGCQGCSSSKATLKDGIERLLVTKFPDFIEEVVDLTDHTAGDNPFM